MHRPRSTHPGTHQPRAGAPHSRLGRPRGRTEPQLHDWTLLSDREHRAAESAAAQPIASAIIGSHQNGHRGLHRPDFVLVRRGGGEIVAIEVELTLKNRKRLERILRGYLRNQNVTMVRYHATQPIAEAVRRAACAVGADSIVELAPLPSTDLATNRSRW